MSLRLYGAFTRWPVMAACTSAGTSGRPSPSSLVDKPMSRLSKRTTQCPRPASVAQNSSSQAIICAARPMISSSGDAPGSPKLS